MAIALRGSASVPNGNPTTSYTVGIDAAVVTDDLLFLLSTSRDSTGAGTLAVTDNDSGGNSWAKIGNSTDHKITLWWKRATSGTANKTVTVSNCVGSASGVLKAFSGGDTGSTPYTDIAIETNASGDETHAGFTPTNADSMVCCGVTNYANDNAVTSLSFATLGATTATEKLSTGGSDCGTIFGHALQNGGPTGTGNLTWAQTNGTTYSIVWAIKPSSAIVMTGDVGSYSITGTAASLEQGYAVIGDIGSYSISGVAATLTAQRKIAGDVGSYAITGTDATFAKGRTMAADVGTYSLTGTAATFPRTYILSGSVGSYATTGTAAELLQGYGFAGDVGAYAATGTAASLGVAHKISGAVGSYAIGGQASSTLWGRALAAAIGSYAVSGQAATFLKGRTMVADAGAYAITGTAAALIRARILSAAAGSYSLTGQAATLTYAGGGGPDLYDPDNSRTLTYSRNRDYFSRLG